MSTINTAMDLPALISAESLKLSLSVLIPGLLKSLWPLIKRLVGIHYSEKIAITERRAKSLTKISELYDKSINPATKNAVKALYDVIGMQYSVKINELLLTFLREKNIIHENKDFQSFIKVPRIHNIQSDSIEEYNKRYRKLRCYQIISTEPVHDFV